MPEERRGHPLLDRTSRPEPRLKEGSNDRRPCAPGLLPFSLHDIRLRKRHVTRHTPPAAARGAARRFDSLLKHLAGGRPAAARAGLEVALLSNLTPRDPAPLRAAR